MGTGETSTTVEPGKILPSVVSVAAGESSSYAVDGDGVLWAWGDNRYGQLGTGGEADCYLPTRIMEGVACVFAGSRHVLAVGTDGTLWGWGDNSYGQLGVGDTATRREPVRIMTGVRKAAAGARHSMALRLDGSLWTWGNGDMGQLGFATDTGSMIPLKLSSDKVTDAAAGSNFSAAVREGALWMWGSNDYGQIGDYQENQETEADKFGTGITVDSSDAQYQQQETNLIFTPTKVLDEVHGLSLGTAFSLSVLSNGDLMGWGDNTGGQLGAAEDDAVLEPLLLQEEVVSAAAGGAHSLYLKSDGSLWGMGYNNYGQLGGVDLGDEDADYRVTEPVKILEKVRLSQRAAAFAEDELRRAIEAAKEPIPLWVWGLAGAAVLIAFLSVWLILSQRRIRRLREAANTAVAQAMALQKQNEKLQASKGTQRRKRRDTEE